MNERRDRIEKALRRTPSADAPDGLNRAIKDEIPDLIDAGAERRSPIWSLAAALLLLVVGGWFAARILSVESAQPVTQIASQQTESAADEAVKERQFEPPASPSADRAVLQKQEPGSEPKDAAIEMESFAVEEQTALDDAMVADLATETRRGQVAEAEPAGPSEDQRAIVDKAVAAVVAKPVAPPAAPPSPPSRTANEPARPQEAGRALARSGVTGGIAAETVESDVASSRPDRIREGSLDAQRKLLSWPELRDAILAGELPPKQEIDLDRIVNHFDYGDRPPRRRGRISLFMEGGAAPLSPSRWRTIRIGLTSRSSSEAVASAAELEVTFNPDVVSLYRELGNTMKIRTEKETVTRETLGSISGDFRESRLFLVKLEPDVDLDEVVAEAVLRYSGDGDEEQVNRKLRVGHVAPTWKTTSRSLQLATLAASLAEYLQERQVPRTGVDLVYLADTLSAASDGDPNAKELVRVVRESVDLRLLR